MVSCALEKETQEIAEIPMEVVERGFCLIQQILYNTGII